MAKPLYSKVVLKRSKVIFKDLSKERVGKYHAVGFAYKDENGENRVEIEPKQTDKELFATTAHELAHNLLPSLTENQIIKFEKTFGYNLWLVVLRLRRKWKKEWAKNLKTKRILDK